MKYSVQLVESAEFDILQLHHFVECNDGPERADSGHRVPQAKR